MLAEQSLEVKLAAGLESESRVTLGVLLERRGNEDLAARRGAAATQAKGSGARSGSTQSSRAASP